MAQQSSNIDNRQLDRPPLQQENIDFERVVDSDSNHANTTAIDGGGLTNSASNIPVLHIFTNLTPAHRVGNNNNTETTDTHGSEDEDAFMRMSDDLLTSGSETADLRGARNRLWGTEINWKIDEVAFGQNPQYVGINAANHKAASNASDTSTTSGPSATSSAARAARRMARRVALSANVATTDILGRLINGSTRAPGQLYSWVSSGFTSPSSGSDSTNTTSYFNINDESVFQPSVSSTTFSTTTTPSKRRPSLSPNMYQTPPTSCGGSANASSTNASSTNVASTTDESLDSTDYQHMTAGTLFERGPDGGMVPTSPVQGADAGTVEDEGHDGFEMIFAMDEATTQAAPTTQDHSHGHGHGGGHNPCPHQDNGIMDETFCVVNTVSSDNKSNI